MEQKEPEGRKKSLPFWGLLPDHDRPQRCPGREAAEPDRLPSLLSAETRGVWYLVEV